MNLRSRPVTVGFSRLLTGSATLLVFATSGCAISLLTVIPKVSLVPKDLLLRHVVCPTTKLSTPQNFHVLGTYEWQRGMVVLYSALCPDDAQSSKVQQVVGHQILILDGIQWQVKASQSYQVKAEAADSKKLVEYRIGRSSLPNRDRYTILYGQVLKPNVATVEATFDNGKILRDEGHDGVFALLAPGATGICEIRILGTDNQILQQEDLATPKQEGNFRRSHQCLPVTQQL